MYVSKYINLNVMLSFNSKYARGNSSYILKVSDFMRLHHFPLILLDSGEDP